MFKRILLTTLFSSQLQSCRTPAAASDVTAANGTENAEVTYCGPNLAPRGQNHRVSR